MTLPPSDDDPILKKRRAALKRQNERRAREAQDVGRFVIEENWGRLAEALRDQENEDGDPYLRDNELEDRAAIRRAFAKYVRDWIESFELPT